MALPVSESIRKAVSTTTELATIRTGTTSYTANNLNQYTAVGAVTPTYDANGNLTSDGTYTLGYDAENRLVSASGAGNTATYAFDAQGRRKSRTVNGTMTIFVTDADNREVLEYDGASGAILNWYAYGLGMNDVLNRMEVSATTRTTYVPDLLGSVVATMDSATGTLAKFGYHPYGGSASAPASFGYTGQRVDAESGGLYYYRARHYSPVLGRFAQPDPAGYSGGINLYAYVDSDPLNLIDPDGLRALDGVQLSLTAASFCPSVCGSAFSLIDAAVSAARGNYVNAAISVGAAAVGVISDAGAVKVGALGAIAAVDAAKTISAARRGAQAAETTLPAIGGRVPNAGGLIREFSQPVGQVYYRVFTGNTTGRFLTAVPPRSSAFAREALALPPENLATFIQQVTVPVGTPLLRSRAIPAFGRRGGAEQFELLNRIPAKNFGPGSPLP